MILSLILNLSNKKYQRKLFTIIFKTRSKTKALVNKVNIEQLKKIYANSRKNNCENQIDS